MADAKRNKGTRPYCVFENGQLAALIRTSSASRAIAAHTAGKYEAHVADADEVHTAAKAGIDIRDDTDVVKTPGLL